LTFAIEHPGDPLPAALAVCLGGGVALFHLTDALMSVRVGTSWPRALRWAVPAVLFPSLVIPVATMIPSAAAVGLAAVVQGVIVLIPRTHRVAAPNIRGNHPQG
jgi:hypothetical protein